MISTNPDFLAALLQVILIDLVLAGDNAIVIGLAASGLPRRQQKHAGWYYGLHGPAYYICTDDNSASSGDLTSSRWRHFALVGLLENVARVARFSRTSI
jgi:hypothetical protein